MVKVLVRVLSPPVKTRLFGANEQVMGEGGVSQERPTVPEKPPTVATVRETDPEEPRAIVSPTGAMEGTSW